MVQLGIRLLRLQAINAGACNRFQCRDSVHFYSRMSSNTSCHHRLDHRKFSQFVKTAGNSVCVDTLELAKRLEKSGIPSEHSVAISSAMSEFCDGILKNISETLVSKDEMQILEMTQERRIAKLRSELQDYQNSLFVKLQGDNEKIRGEFNGLKSHFEKTKNDFLKYSIAPLLVFAVGIGVAPMFLN